MILATPSNISPNQIVPPKKRPQLKKEAGSSSSPTIFQGTLVRFKGTVFHDFSSKIAKTNLHVQKQTPFVVTIYT